MNRSLNVIYDATVLTNGFHKNNARSGVYFTAKNILDQLLNRNDVNVSLYVSPEKYADEFRLKDEDYADGIFLHDFSNYYLVVLAKITTRLWRTFENDGNGWLLRKSAALGIKLLQTFFKNVIKISNKNKIKTADVWFSPIYPIPDAVCKNKIVKKCVFLHDAIPLLHIYRGNEPKKYSNSISKLIRQVDSSFLFFSNSTQTLMDYKKITSSVNDLNAVVTPLAVSKNIFREESTEKEIAVKRKYNIPLEKKYVFSLCSVEPRKNLVRAVRCFMEFIKKHDIKDLVWVLGGDQWELFADEFKRNGVDWNFGCVIQTGYVDDEDLSVLYSHAEWFVYTSQYEGFGLPPLEAMRCGCPVITSNNSSLPEVVGDAGIMIDWNSDEQHIGAYEKYYYNEDLRRAYRQRGMERACQFSWEKTTEKIVETMKSASMSSTKMNIIYRVCDKVGASSSGKRCFNVSKNQLTKRCLQSLKRNVEEYSGNITIYCVADNCSDDIVDYIRELFPDVKLYRYEKIGNAKSFCECVELASGLPNGEQVYFLEDDYLMLDNNVLGLLNFNLSVISREKSRPIAIMPDDYPDRYVDNVVKTECRVTEKGHFLKIDKSTCTFATYTDVVKKYKKNFMAFIGWPKITEDKSVNKVWEKVPLYQPIPAWTLHSQIKSVIPIYLDYAKIKDYFEKNLDNAHFN